MNDSGDNLPIGFRGPVRTWSSLVPAARRVLRLPQQWASLRDPSAGNDRFDLVEVRAVTERIGRIEDALIDLAERLADEGTLLLDVDNLQSMRMLRQVVDGHPGSFEPAGSADDPSQALPLRRVLHAVAGASLHLNDVIAVPAARELDGGFARELFGRGLLPIEWLAGPPPSRFWLVCRKQRACAGSVLIAGGDDAARRATADLVRPILPDGWEVVTAAAGRECAQWNRGIARARGELVWLLRGGSTPTSALFAALLPRAGIGAVMPAGPAGGDAERPADVAGLMLPRLDALLAGSLPEDIGNTAVALEEYCMRLGSRLPPVELVTEPLETPPPPVDEPASFAAEAARLVERWSPLQPDAAGVSAAAAESAASPPWAGREPRITLCMIAKDEERFLPECLRRAAAAVDEIVLVDTGSTDRTVAIAESFGARVLHEPWQDDFSAPRNVAIAAATGDWILVLDADEFLAPGAAERIRELVRRAGVSGYHLRFTNHYTGGKTVGVMMVRLFRNLPGLAYENVIHEQVTPSLQRAGAACGLVLSSSEVEVEHHGYADEVMDARGKNERNERLFSKQMAVRPDDVYTHYKYGDFLRRIPGRAADARALLSRGLELILDGPPSLPRELPYAGEIAALCALERARAGDKAGAREIVDVALRRFLPTPNLYYLAAGLALAEGRAADAIACYRRCLAYRGQVLVVPIQEGITSYVSLTGIARAYILRGERDRARALLEQAVAVEPSYEVAHLALSQLRLEQGDPGGALRVLSDFLAAHPDSPGACQQTTFILQRLGQTSQARRMGRHAVQLLEARALDHEAAEMNRFLAAI